MADDELLSVELVTPERVLVVGTASQVILRTADGDITFLPGHTPLVGAVVPCVVRVVGAGESDGAELRAAVHGGFVQVGQDAPPDPGESGVPRRTRVTLLAGVAELAGEIDTERARVALDAATARVAELGTAGRGAPAVSGEEPEEDRELAEAEAALRRAEVRLEAAGVAAGATS